MAWSSYFGGYNQEGGGAYTSGSSGSGSESKNDPYGMRGDTRRSGPLMTNNDWTWAYGSPSDVQRSSGGSRTASRSGGGGGGGGSKSSTTVQRLRFTEDAPGLPDLPVLEMPKVDKRKIRALTQQIAAPSVRKLQEGLQGSLNVHTDNPNVRRMTIREALQGYGTGLEGAMAGAGSQARQEHQQELNLLGQEAHANFKAKYESVMADYQNRFRKYMESAEKVTQTDSSEMGASGGVPMVVRRNAWGTPELGPSFQAGYNMKRGRDPMYGIDYPAYRYN
jgi:hypothetical protein